MTEDKFKQRKILGRLVSTTKSYDAFGNLRKKEKLVQAKTKRAKTGQKKNPDTVKTKIYNYDGSYVKEKMKGKMAMSGPMEGYFREKKGSKKTKERKSKFSLFGTPGSPINKGKTREEIEAKNKKK